MRPRPASPSPSARELRGFALLVGVALAALGALALRGGHGAGAATLLALGAALLTAGLLAPRRLRPVHAAWMALALALSRVTTPVLMAVVYYGLFTPIGLLLRLAGRRPLARDRAAPTFWADRPAGARRSDLRRQF
jgi:hypothetical protein